MTRRWLAWAGMIAGFAVFCVADIFAATQEKDGARVTASSWMRFAVRKSFGGALIAALAWVGWHFGVQAWFPSLPL